VKLAKSQAPALLGGRWSAPNSQNGALRLPTLGPLFNDDNASGCMRDIKTDDVQMKDDITWTENNIYFDFLPVLPNCSGASESTVYAYLALMLWSSPAYVLCILYCMGY
jgi:hypothetical protein